MTLRVRIAVHHPAWHICGGGEAYVGSLAEVLSEHHDVTLLVTTRFDPDRLSRLLALGLKNVRVHELSEADVAAAMRSFDLGIRVATARVPRATARRNLLHVQTPIVPRGFLRSPWLGFHNRRAVADYERVVFNSKFTAATCRGLSLGAGVPVVLYPPVDIGTGERRCWDDRDPVILSVGRFCDLGQL